MAIKQIKIKNTDFIAPNWEQMGGVVFDLAKQIIKLRKKYDWIITIAKGGWTWSRTLGDFLEMDNIASVKAKLYSGVKQTSEILTIEQTLPANVDIRNKNILLFDDVADSGKTLLAISNYLLESGAKSVQTATLFYKPKSSLIPDFYSYKTSAWIIFPHEIREFIKLTYKKFTKKNYQSLGLPSKQVNFFLDEIHSTK